MGSLKIVNSQDASLRVQRPATPVNAEPDPAVVQLRAAQVWIWATTMERLLTDLIVEIMFSVGLGEIMHNEFSSKIVVSCIPAPIIQDAGRA
jgi:hypothetical protein